MNSSLVFITVIEIQLYYAFGYKCFKRKPHTDTPTFLPNKLRIQLSEKKQKQFLYTNF